MAGVFKRVLDLDLPEQDADKVEPKPPTVCAHGRSIGACYECTVPAPVREALAEVERAGATPIELSNAQAALERERRAIGRTVKSIGNIPSAVLEPTRPCPHGLNARACLECYHDSVAKQRERAASSNPRWR